MLTRKQGRGTFVNDQASDALASRFCRISASNGKPIGGDAKTIEIVEAPANDEERRRLHLGARDSVYRVRGVCLNGDLPFMLEEASLPAALFPGLLEKKGVEHRIVALAQLYGILLGKAEERISIGPAPATIAETLRVAPDTAVMRLDRLLLTLDRHPVEWRVAHCHLAGGFYLAEMG